MKNRITDLLDNLPIELLKENEKKEINKFKFKRIIPVIIIIVVLLCGCTAFFVYKMPERIDFFLSGSSEKLIDELYNETYEYIDDENYRLAVEGIVSDGVTKKIAITITALSDSAKENFSLETCPTPLIKMSYSGSLFGPTISKEDEYKAEYYLEIDSTTSDEGRICLDEWGELLSFSIEPKENKQISIQTTKNNSCEDYKLTQVVIYRTSITFYTTLKVENMESAEIDKMGSIDISPTVYIVFKDGTKKLINKGKMGYEVPESGIGNVTSIGVGDFLNATDLENARVFINPIDLDEVEKVIINDVEYLR